jgi:hypothetical protein
MQSVMHDEMYNDDGIHKQSDSSDDHRTGLCSRIQFSLGPNCQAKCGKGHRRCGCEEASKSPRLYDIANDCKERDNQPPKDEAQNQLYDCSSHLDVNSATALVRFEIPV